MVMPSFFQIFVFWPKNGLSFSFAWLIEGLQGWAPHLRALQGAIRPIFNQYNPRQQFLGEDCKFLSLIQLSDVYSDDDLQNEGVSIDHFCDDIVHLHHRLHCISSDLELDLFNKSVILSDKSFTSAVGLLATILRSVQISGALHALIVTEGL